MTVYLPLKEFFANLTVALVTFNAWAERVRPAATADHVCYKCGSDKEYEHLRLLLSLQSPYTYESFVSLRRIAVVRFSPSKMPTSPIGPFTHLELSAQKPDGSQVSGFDHVEIVPEDGNMTALAEELCRTGLLFHKAERPHHETYDAKLPGGLKVRIEAEPLINMIKRDEMW